MASLHAYGVVDYARVRCTWPGLAVCHHLLSARTGWRIVWKEREEVVGDRPEKVEEVVGERPEDLHDQGGGDADKPH